MRLKQAGRAEVDSGNLLPRGMAQAGKLRRGRLGQTVAEGHSLGGQAVQRWARADCGRGAQLRRVGRTEVSSDRLRPRGTARRWVVVHSLGCEGSLIAGSCL
ncbi:hypothetical protein C4D60_Mb02t21260 [Musa balbisiana]|uniref:Uncharacterized protein n=1 Tax=Musa balbisiana TaxID=52838 RepID=A0A4S8ICA8_MUSBA|nr:hypothetical protein C4D60_Mb02t21260 [Musa balbisiana]